jgi:O-antigen/teichoic acid export membrane protein
MLNYQGVLIGLAAFFIIGLFHPLVIKLEYRYGKRYWWLLFVPAIFFVILSLFLTRFYSIIAGCLGFAFLWSTGEIFMQHNRVLKGQAKRNPDRKY